MSNATKKIRVNVQYSGTVQGVGFRMTAVSQATGLSVVGWAMNEPDGGVRLQAEGPKGDVEQLLRRIRNAMGDRIEAETSDTCEPLGSETEFRIRY